MNAPTGQRRFAHAFLALAALSSCGGMSDALRAKLDGVKSAEKSPQVEASRQAAPQLVAEAENALRRARKLADAGDEVGAAIQADLALAIFEHAAVLARLARADATRASATAELEKRHTELAALGAAEEDLARKRDALRKELEVREATHPGEQPAAASPARDAARKRAAVALLGEAKLLCHAAELLDSADKRAAVPDADWKEARDALGGPAHKAVHHAAEMRERCLERLWSHRKKAARSAHESDALLTALSKSSDFAAHRDERGVVVTLEAPFAGGQPTKSTNSRLEALGQVAREHPTVPVQVVWHRASPVPASAATRSTLDTVRSALERAGASRSRVGTEYAGAELPRVHPSSRGAAALNERLEIVFVTRGR